MLIESFLTKIVAAIFKKAAISAIAAIGTALEVYSIIDTLADLSDVVTSTNDSHELAVIGLEVISNPLTEAAIDNILSIGSDTFTVEKLNSGVYIASRFTPPFKTSLQFPRFNPTKLTKPDLRKINAINFPEFKGRKFNG